MSDQQAQELRRRIAMAIHGETPDGGVTFAEIEGARLDQADRVLALLAARPVQVERPDEALREALKRELMDRLNPKSHPVRTANYERTFDTAIDAAFAAARLPERPDEGDR